MKQIFCIILSGLYLLASSTTYAQTCNAKIIKNKPDSLYNDKADGIVTDTKTKLMWQKCTLGKVYSTGSCTGTATPATWQDALSAANNNTQYGYSDWRLPNKNELSSLLEGACFAPSINEKLFPNTVSSYYWSSSPNNAIDQGNAWVVNFHYGGVGNQYKKTEKHYIRLVRGGR